MLLQSYSGVSSHFCKILEQTILAQFMQVDFASDDGIDECMHFLYYSAIKSPLIFYVLEIPVTAEAYNFLICECQI